jgi:Fe-S-cluster containining protein
MKITTDLEYIKRMAAIKEDENWKFRSYLKQLDLSTEDIDAIVHRITDEVTAQIDCTKCANCCKKINPTLDKEDIARFARGLNIPVAEFQERYLIQNQENGSIYRFNGLPCLFLKNKRCSNYAFRPEDCHSYPHLEKNEFVHRLMGTISNYEICPIVFNVYEQLKTELWKNRRRT